MELLLERRTKLRFLNSLSLIDSLWKRLIQGRVLWLQGPPGSCLAPILSQMGARWRLDMSGEYCHLQCDGITDVSGFFLALRSFGAPQAGDALVLHYLDPSLAVPGLISHLEGLGCTKIIISSPFDPPVGLPDHVVIPPISADQTLELLENGSGGSDALLQARRSLAQAIGGSYGAVLTAAELLQIIPPSETESLCKDVYRVFDLSPRQGLLEDEVISCLNHLPQDQADAAVKWGLWGAPLSPEALTDLFGESGLSLAASLVQLHLAQPLGRRFSPLPHFVWAVQRSESKRPKLKEEAWRGLTKWMLERSGDDHLALALVFERRSSSSPAWIEAWSRAASMALHLGFTEIEKNGLTMMAACHAAMGDDLAQAELLVSAASGEEKIHCSSERQIVLGTLRSLQGRTEEGAKLLRLGIEGVRRDGRKMLEAAACCRLGLCLLDMGQIVASSSALRQAVDAANNGGRILLPKILDLQAFVVGLQGRSDESLRIQLESVLVWEHTDHSCADHLAKLGYGLVCWLRGLPDQAEQEIAASIAGLVEEELWEDAVKGFATSSAAAMGRGRADLALELVARAEHLARKQGSSIPLEWGKVTRCWALMALGRLNEADAQIEELARHVLEGRHRLLFPAIAALHAARASLRGEHPLAVLLEGVAAQERRKSMRQISQGEQLVLRHFLGASRIALYPDEAAAYEAAGSMIPVGAAVSNLLLDRRLLDHPEGGILRPKGQKLLGRREMEVLELIAEGSSNTQIASVLEVTVGTVKRQVHALKKKLNCESRISLMHAAQAVIRATAPQGAAKSR